MSKVLVTREKLDKLASIIGGKADVAVPLTIDGTIAAAETLGKGGANLQTKSVSITPSESAQSRSVTPDTGYDGLDQVNVNVSAVPEAVVTYDGSEAQFYDSNGFRKFKERTIDFVGTGGFSGPYETGNSIYGNWITHMAIAKNTSVTPTESSQTIGGASYMMEGAVTVNAIPSNYVGSGITQRTSSDVTSSGDTVTIPGGFYGSSVTKIISAVTQDNDGYLVLDDEGSGGGGGSSGLVYETGTITPTTNVTKLTISFSNTHDKIPIYAMIMDDGSEYDGTTYTNAILYYIDYYGMSGFPIYQSTTSLRYGEVRCSYRSTSTTSLTSTANTITNPPSNTSTSSGSYYRYWITESAFYPYCSSSSYWRTGKTYKWIAVWAPTT